MTKVTLAGKELMAIIIFQLAAAYAQAIMRTKQYERRLGSSRQRQRRNRRRAQMSKLQNFFLSSSRASNCLMVF